MSKKKVVVFDVDGTLFDTKLGIIQALNYVLHDLGRKSIPLQEENLYIGPPIKDSFIKLQGLDESMAEEATRQFRRVYVEKYIAQSNAYEGMELLLQDLLKDGITLGVATMKTAPQIEKLFKISGFEKYFDVVMVAKEDGSQSKEQMLLSIKEKYLDAVYYMVGDTNGDYRATQETGYIFVGADYGYGKIEMLDTAHISKPEELKWLLTKMV